MGSLVETYRNWALGVVTAVRPDNLPPDAASRGINSQLLKIGGGLAVPAKRPGVECENTSPMTGEPAVIGMYEYKKRDGTQLHLVMGDSGELAYLNGGVLTTLSSSFTAGDYPPDFATAADLCFIVNGQDRFKLRGLIPENFSIVRPTAGPSLMAGIGSAMTGDYEGAISYYNSNTDHESSRSDEGTITLTASGLQFDWTAPPDPQVTHVRCYIRKPLLGNRFLRVGEVAVGTLTLNVEVSDSAYKNLIQSAPDTTENDPPPAGIRYLAWHRARLFAADEFRVYYSKIEKPEAFDNAAFEPINPDDGQVITGLLSFDDILVVTKRDSVWAIVGDDPTTWIVRQISADTGNTSHRSMSTIEGIAYWWSEHGPVAWAGSGGVIDIGQGSIYPDIDSQALNFSYLNKVAATIDSLNQRVLFAVPEIGKAELTKIIPYNYRLGVWESTKWDPMDIGSIATVEDSSGAPRVHIGNYGGQVFQFNNSVFNDGVKAGTTHSGTFVAGSFSQSMITDGAATFDTTGGGLKKRVVRIQDSTGLTVQRRVITSNTSTSFIMDQAVTLITGDTYTYYIGGIDFFWSGIWSDSQLPWNKKRYEYLYLEFASNTPAASVSVDINFDEGTAAGATKSITVSTAGASAIWDVSLWDNALWASIAIAPHRIRVGRTGRKWRATLRNRVPDVSLIFHKMGMRVETFRDRS